MKILFKIFIIAALFFSGLSGVNAQTSQFRFGTWADTKSGLSTLSTLSVQMAAKNPLFIFYPGDLCDSGPTTSCLNTWKNSYNSGGDLLSRSFPSRGNHDNSGTSAWTSYFDMAGTAAGVGVNNFTQLSADLTYSFDYGNSHFVVIDMPGGDATTMSTAQLNWMDSDLTSAESRGVTHSFLFWHGPIYPMGGHCCTNATNIIPVLNKHPSVSAAFHGHEHNLSYSHLDNTKISTITHPFEEFVIGSAGAGLYSCQRGDWCQKISGFATIDVNGGSFTVNIYNQSGSAIKTLTFSKSPNQTPTISPTSPPASTPTRTPTPSPSHTPTPTRTPTPNPSSSPAPPTSTPTGYQDNQPGFPIRAAFYYPWFPESWTQSGIYPYTKYHPTLGFYSVYDTNIIKSHIQSMLYGHLNAGISSWWGQGHHTDDKFPLLLRAADATGWKWSIYYENEGSSNPSVSQIQSDLNYIKNNYGSDVNYLRVNGKFVVFVYADTADNCTMADRWVQANSSVGAYIVLKVFSGYRTCASQPDSWHQYAPAVAADLQNGYSYSISPAFDKVGEATRLARDINRWQTNIQDMVNSAAPFQLITTFNEWGEGSAVESATEWNSSSGYGTYLDALHNIIPGISPTSGGNKPGDTDGDNDVDIYDYNTLISHFGTNWSAADFNNNGSVDIYDYNTLISNFGR